MFLHAGGELQVILSITKIRSTTQPNSRHKTAALDEVTKIHESILGRKPLSLLGKSGSVLQQLACKAFVSDRDVSHTALIHHG